MKKLAKVGLAALILASVASRCNEKPVPADPKPDLVKGVVFQKNVFLSDSVKTKNYSGQDREDTFVVEDSSGQRYGFYYSGIKGADTIRVNDKVTFKTGNARKDYYYFKYNNEIFQFHKMSVYDLKGFVMDANN